MTQVCEKHEGIFTYKYHIECPICEEIEELKEKVNGLKREIEQLNWEREEEDWWYWGGENNE